MDNSVRIRRAAGDDIPGMVALLGELFSLERDFTPDAARQRRGLETLLEDGGRACAMVAVDGDGHVCGMATVQLVASTAEGAASGWIEDVVVERRWRRRGVASSLLKSLMEWGAQNGATRFQLLADRGNGGALEFYRRQGWESTSMICLRRN